MTTSNAAQPRVATFGPWRGPAFVVVTGDKGIGKSLDQTLVDPLAWTLGEPGCLKGARWFMGDQVHAVAESLIVPVSDLWNVVAVLEDMAAGKRERRNVRIDDLTVVASTTLLALTAKFGNGGGAVYAKWDAYNALVDRIKVLVTTMGVHVFASTHLAQPHQTPNHGFVKGGPDVGGPKGMSTLLSVAHAVYKAEPDKSRWPYPACYRCDNPSETWEFKDRHNVLLGTGPMNLREILLAAGYGIPRYPGMEWQDEWADKVAADVAAGGKPADVFAEATRKLTEAGVDRGVAYTTARDGLCRAELSVRPDPLSRAINTSGQGVAGGPPVAVINPAGASK